MVFFYIGASAIHFVVSSVLGIPELPGRIGRRSKIVFNFLFFVPSTGDNNDCGRAFTDRLNRPPAKSFFPKTTDFRDVHSSNSARPAGLRGRRGGIKVYEPAGRNYA